MLRQMLRNLSTTIQNSPSASFLARNWTEFANVVSTFHANNIRIEDLSAKNLNLQKSFSFISSQEKLVPLLLQKEKTSPNLLYACYAIVKLHLERGNVESAFITFKALTEFLYTTELLIVPDGKPGDKGYPANSNAMANSMLVKATKLVNTSKKKKSWHRIHNISLPDHHFDLLSQFRRLEDKIPQNQLFSYHIISIFILLRRLGSTTKIGMQFTRQQIDTHISKLLKSKLNEAELFQFSNTVLHVMTFREPLYEDIRLFRNSLKENFNYDFSLSNYTVLMQACLRTRRFEKVQEYYDELITAGHLPDDNVHSIMVKLYCSTYRHEEALDLVLKQGNGTRNLWNALLNGYAKSNKPIEKVAEVYSLMLSKGYEDDIGLLTIMLQAFAKRNHLEKVIEIFDKILDAGYTPDKYIYGILQNLALQNQDILTFRDWFQKAFNTTLKFTPQGFERKNRNPYDSVQSMTELFRQYAKFGNASEVFTKKFITLLGKQNILLEDPVAAKLALQKYLTSPGGKKRVPQLLRFLVQKNIPDYNSFLSIAILNQAKQETDEKMIAWSMLQENQNGESADGEMIRNLYLASATANDPSNLDSIFNLFKGLRIPMKQPFVSACLNILCNTKRERLKTAEKTRKALMKKPVYLLERYIFNGDLSYLQEEGGLVDPKFKLHLSRNKVFFWHAMRFAKYQLFKSKRKLDDVCFEYLCDDAMNCLDPENTMIEVHGLIHSLDRKASPVYFGTAYRIFFMRLFHSQNWRIAFFFLNPYWNDPGSIQFQYFLDYIKTESDRDVLLLLWEQVRQKFPPKQVLKSLLEKLSIDLKCAADSKVIFESIPRSWMHEDIHWVYVRGLVWNKEFDETLWMCTGGYNPKPKDTGLVMIEMCRYFRQNGLIAQEQKLVRYWRNKKPEWIERI